MEQDEQISNLEELEDRLWDLLVEYNSKIKVVELVGLLELVKNYVLNEDKEQ